MGQRGKAIRARGLFGPDCRDGEPGHANPLGQPGRAASARNRAQACRHRVKLIVGDPTGDTSGFGSTLVLAAGGSIALIGGSTAGYREVWEFARTAKGFHARVVQHECDHLDGTLYPSRMSDLTKLIFESEARHWAEEE